MTTLSLSSPGPSGDHWINMIHNFISSVTYSILVNGTPTRCFKSSQGVIQVNPLSPYLFIICMEILSRIIQKKLDEEKLPGFKVSLASPYICNLLFADDVFIFCMATLSKARELVDTLQQFANITGQEINYNKSSCLFNKLVPKLNRRMIKKI